MRTPLLPMVVLACLTVVRPAHTDGSKTLDIYSIDVEGGGATLFVSPSGESLLVDAGNPGARDADRIAAAVKTAGLSQIDYLVTSHFHSDHVGGAADLAARVPIRTFVDHGSEVHDGSAFRLNDAIFRSYLETRAKGRHLEVKAGQTIPVKGLTVTVVSADGATIGKPLRGGGASNALCRDFVAQDEDVSENARSVGVVVGYGRFHMLNLGDLTWNTERQLVCPNNLLGRMDVYLTTHHGLNLSGPPVLVHAIRPRVAVMNNGPRKGASREAWLTVRNSPGLEDLWQLHYAMQRPGNPAFHESGESGGKALNAPDEQIANLDDTPTHTPAHVLRVSARDDGGFTVTNSRNGFSKTYAPRR
jgi:beta-lactamase superfamily II metal-dependent hydrolase